MDRLKSISKLGNLVDKNNLVKSFFVNKEKQKKGTYVGTLRIEDAEIADLCSEYDASIELDEKNDKMKVEKEKDEKIKTKKDEKIKTKKDENKIEAKKRRIRKKNLAKEKAAKRAIEDKFLKIKNYIKYLYFYSLNKRCPLEIVPLNPSTKSRIDVQIKLGDKSMKGEGKTDLDAIQSAALNLIKENVKEYTEYTQYSNTNSILEDFDLFYPSTLDKLIRTNFEEINFNWIKFDPLMDDQSLFIYKLKVENSICYSIYHNDMIAKKIALKSMLEILESKPKHHEEILEHNEDNFDPFRNLSKEIDELDELMDDQ